MTDKFLLQPFLGKDVEKFPELAKGKIVFPLLQPMIEGQRLLFPHQFNRNIINLEGRLTIFLLMQVRLHRTAQFFHFTLHQLLRQGVIKNHKHNHSHHFFRSKIAYTDHGIEIIPINIAMAVKVEDFKHPLFVDLH